MDQKKTEAPVTGAKSKGNVQVLGGLNSNRSISRPFDKKFEEETVKFIYETFRERQEERRFLERSWELNMNFLSGNQYCDVSAAGELEEEQPRYWWMTRRVYNHIAPAIDTHCAKLAQVRSTMTVRAATGEERDLQTAKIATNVLRSVCEECGFDDVVSRATMWSETCGTAFYKILWDANSKSAEGGVRIAAVSPFEIYPEDLSGEKLADQGSIMHVKAVPVSEIFERYGLRVEGKGNEITRGGAFVGRVSHRVWQSAPVTPCGGRALLRELDVRARGALVLCGHSDEGNRSICVPDGGKVCRSLNLPGTHFIFRILAEDCEVSGISALFLKGENVS